MRWRDSGQDTAPPPPDDRIDPLLLMDTRRFPDWPDGMLAARAARGLPTRCQPSLRCRISGRCRLCGWDSASTTPTAKERL